MIIKIVKLSVNLIYLKGNNYYIIGYYINNLIFINQIYDYNWL